MKKFLSFIGIIGCIIVAICDIAEFLAIPALLVVCGMLNSLPWQYYVISIGAYILLFALLEIIASFVFKLMEKKYTPVIERKLVKLTSLFRNRK